MDRQSLIKEKKKRKEIFLTFTKIPSRSSSSVSESFAAFLPDFFPFGVVVDLDLRATLVSFRSVFLAALAFFAAFAAAEVACFLPMIYDMLCLYPACIQAEKTDSNTSRNIPRSIATNTKFDDGLTKNHILF